ncbi:MAG TPA: hypothetical protein VJ691_15835 [Vicinamibacterales bacterium]|nr:hypothetical protein [Vicinamibacterales bacterium]
MRHLSVLVVALLAATAPLSAAGTSAELAADLVKLMEQRNLETIAAAHPTDAGRFVAAMHIKGVQLLVISGRYSAPQLLKEHLVKSDYRQVYLDLNSAADRQGRLFITDSQANGLRVSPEKNAPFDISWRDMTAQVLYNNDWKGQKLNEAAYRKRFAEDETEYAAMLEILKNAIEARPAT